MRIYLERNEAIEKSFFEFSTLWPEVIFRYRDFSKLKTGKTGKIYHIFCLSGFSLLTIFIFQFLKGVDVTHPVAKIMIGIFGIVILPMIAGLFYLFWKQKYY
jgi:hypothetical protein